MTSAMMVTSILSLAVGLVIPAVTALITKEHVSDALKVFLTALLTALSGGLSGALTSIPHGWHQWEPIAWNIGLGWVAALVTFATGFSPLGTLKWVGHKTAGFGIGTPRPDAGFIDLFGLLAMAIFIDIVLTALAFMGLLTWWAVAVWAALTLAASLRVGMVTHRTPLRR